MAVYGLALLCKGDSVLFVERINASFGNGMYSLVGGKIEAGESVLQGIVREIYEEVGLRVQAADAQLVHLFCRKGASEDVVAACFKIDISNLPEPYNKEPLKHRVINFFTYDSLPENILPMHKKALECIQQAVLYSEDGYTLL